MEKHEIKNKRTCKKGHSYYKSSDCPVSPVCEKEKKPEEGFLSLLSAPARRALEKEKITTLKKLSKYPKKDLLNLHGVGPSAIPVLEKALKEANLSFAEK